MRVVSIFLCTMVIAVTALPISRLPMWWIRIWDFPRIQIAAIGLVSIFLLAIFRSEADLIDLVILAITMVAVLLQAWMIHPYTRLVAPQTARADAPENAETVSFLFANVLMTNRNSEALLKILADREADIVLLVETDAWWLEQVRDALPTHEYTLFHPLENTYGMLLFSRLALISPEVKFLVHDHVPSIHSGIRLASGREITMRCIHPPPPVYGEAVSSEPRDAELIVVGKENRKDDMPFVVFGDLNDVAWSRTNFLFQRVSGLLDPRIGRGFYSTFHAKIPLLRMPLDHLFHSKHFKLVNFETLSYFGSDHFPVYAELALEGDAAIVQDEPQPTPADIEEAVEKLEYIDRADPDDICRNEFTGAVPSMSDSLLT